MIGPLWLLPRPNARDNAMNKLGSNVASRFESTFPLTGRILPRCLAPGYDDRFHYSRKSATYCCKCASWNVSPAVSLV